MGYLLCCFDKGIYSRRCWICVWWLRLSLGVFGCVCVVFVAVVYSGVVTCFVVVLCVVA